LAGGIATWLGDRTQVVACETEGTSGYAQALAAGEPVDIRVSGVAADALGASRIGDLAWEQLSARAAASVVVTDDEVEVAREAMWDRFRIVVEPSAAVPIAALLSGRYEPAPDAHIGVVVCGANTRLG
jgi:threonine dehydratase